MDRVIMTRRRLHAAIPLESSQLWAEDHDLAQLYWGYGWRPQPVLTLRPGQRVLHTTTLFGVVIPHLTPDVATVLEPPEDRGNGSAWVTTTDGVIECDDGTEVWARDR